jgi:hypothetical protein
MHMLTKIAQESLERSVKDSWNKSSVLTIKEIHADADVLGLMIPGFSKAQWKVIVPITSDYREDISFIIKHGKGLRATYEINGLTVAVFDYATGELDFNRPAKPHNIKGYNHKKVFIPLYDNGLFT